MFYQGNKSLKNNVSTIYIEYIFQNVKKALLKSEKIIYQIQIDYKLKLSLNSMNPEITK